MQMRWGLRIAGSVATGVLLRAVLVMVFMRPGGAECPRDEAVL